MPLSLRFPLFRTVRLLAALVVVKTTVAIVAGYRSYLPPDFRADFLLGREGYFFGGYAVAFYAHIASGPFCLLAGLLLLSDDARRRWPSWHRRLGRAHVIAVLLLLTPSGLWMARYAMSGVVAGTGFAVLAIFTAVTAAMGWRRATQRRFADHRRWMQRCFALLVSAVVLRIIGGASTVLGATELYPISAWLCWLVPLAALELSRLKTQTLQTLRRLRS